MYLSGEYKSSSSDEANISSVCKWLTIAFDDIIWGVIIVSTRSIYRYLGKQIVFSMKSISAKIKTNNPPN